jgi:hypothetical protein
MDGSETDYIFSWNAFFWKSSVFGFWKESRLSCVVKVAIEWLECIDWFKWFGRISVNKGKNVIHFHGQYLVNSNKILGTWLFKECKIFVYQALKATFANFFFLSHLFETACFWLRVAFMFILNSIQSIISCFFLSSESSSSLDEHKSYRRFHVFWENFPVHQKSIFLYSSIENDFGRFFLSEIVLNLWISIWCLLLGLIQIRFSPSFPCFFLGFKSSLSAVQISLFRCYFSYCWINGLNSLILF